jgi:hypothetical protein
VFPSGHAECLAYTTKTKPQPSLACDGPQSFERELFLARRDANACGSGPKCA